MLACQEVLDPSAPTFCDRCRSRQLQWELADICRTGHRADRHRGCLQAAIYWPYKLSRGQSQLYLSDQTRAAGCSRSARMHAGLGTQSRYTSRTPAQSAVRRLNNTPRSPWRHPTKTYSRVEDHSILKELCGIEEVGGHDMASAFMDIGPLEGSLRVSRKSTTATELYLPSLVVFSGGTAFNSIAGHLRQLTTRVTHVLPVSDDGGSTAEIVRVLGGPAVGDIRSRCLRLADDSDHEARAVKRLLGYRLPSSDPTTAKLQWYEIVEGTHELWTGVSEPYKHMIRAFLVHFQNQILSHSTQQFCYCNGSIGNFFFAGARTFFRSMESAIFLFSRVARIPEGSTVLPAIVTEEVITLGAELEDGTVLKGQNCISHPNTPPTSSGGAAPSSSSRPSSRPPSPQASVVDKEAAQPPLPSPIRRVFYLSREGTGREHEVSPAPNPRLKTELGRADAIIYAIGSLYTSICPTLILQDVGEALAARPDTPKVLLLNGSHDRETSSSGAHPGPMRASDVVQAVVDALNRRRSRQGPPLKHGAPTYINLLLVPAGGAIMIDQEALTLLGLPPSCVVEVDSERDKHGRVVFQGESLVRAIGNVLYERGLLTCNVC